METRTYKEKLEQQLKEIINELDYLAKRGVNDEKLNAKYHSVLKKIENKK
jgi:hypothetical protein